MHLSWDADRQQYMHVKYGFKFNTLGYRLVKPTLIKRDIVYAGVNKELVKFFREFEVEQNSKPKRPIHLVIKRFSQAILDFEVTAFAQALVLLETTQEVHLVCLKGGATLALLRCDQESFTPFLMMPSFFNTQDCPYIVVNTSGQLLSLMRVATDMSSDLAGAWGTASINGQSTELRVLGEPYQRTSIFGKDGCLRLICINTSGELIMATVNRKKV
jgi:hypothetical protein